MAQSWLQCFTLYMAVVVSKHPEKTKELLAYQAMIIGEARRCVGRGCLLYDAAFHQSFKAVNFRRITSSCTQLTTFLAYGEGRMKTCTECMMADNARKECALHPNRILASGAAQGDWEGSRERGLESTKRSSDPKRRRVCFTFNEGTCTFGPDCQFEHQCTVCKVYGDHGCSVQEGVPEGDTKASHGGAGRQDSFLGWMLGNSPNIRTPSHPLVPIVSILV